MSSNIAAMSGKGPKAKGSSGGAAGAKAPAAAKAAPAAAPQKGGGGPPPGGLSTRESMARKARTAPVEKVVAKNRKAYFDYEVLEEIEAGLVLVGTEVKSLRAGHLVLGDAYARFDRGELYLVNAHIPEYKMAGHSNHAPNRARKLLLGGKEVAKISERIEERGLTVIPLSVYFKNGYAKVMLGVCRGKKNYDKRASIAARDATRSAARADRQGDRD